MGNETLTFVVCTQARRIITLTGNVYIIRPCTEKVGTSGPKHQARIFHLLTTPLFLKFLRSLVDIISYSIADFKIVIHFPIFCVNHQCNIFKGVSVDRREEYSRIIPGQNLRSLDVDHEVVGAADCCYLKTHLHLYWLRTSKRFD